MKQIATYGTWPSPVSAQDLAAGTARVSDLHVIDGTLFWAMQDPRIDAKTRIYSLDEQGDCQCVSGDQSEHDHNIRTRVHEYGGGAFWGGHGKLYGCDDETQQIISLIDGKPLTLKPAVKHAIRYANGVVLANDQGMVVVRERHDDKVTNELVWIIGDTIDVIASGDDFYTQPVVNLQGDQLAWISWCHPNMPWEQTQLWLADITGSGQLTNVRVIAKDAAIINPQFSQEGVLHYCSDQTGFFNLYRWVDDQSQSVIHIDFDCALPHWVFGTNSYDFLANGEIVFFYFEEGQYRIGITQPDGKWQPVEIPEVAIADNIRATDKGFVYFGASATQGYALIHVDHKTWQRRVLYEIDTNPLPKQAIAVGESIWANRDHANACQAFFYPPQSDDYQGPADTAPPLIVMAHGGPTAMTHPGFSLKVQFWTTRGFSVLDLNYRGSSGFGRAYREALNEGWGVVEVDDVIACVKYLIAQAMVDPKRLAITGGSAGGLTTLAALTFHDCFAAGGCYYGVSDCETLVNDTHKFEAYYCEHLIGPYPQQKERYYQRSPINFFEKMQAPIIIFQGLEDKVVPPSQAEKMVAVLKQHNRTYEYMTFANEGHGFRDPDNVAKAREAEYQFYLKVFGLA